MAKVPPQPPAGPAGSSAPSKQAEARLKKIETQLREIDKKLERAESTYRILGVVFGGLSFVFMVVNTFIWSTTRDLLERESKIDNLRHTLVQDLEERSDHLIDGLTITSVKNGERVQVARLVKGRNSIKDLAEHDETFQALSALVDTLDSAFTNVRTRDNDAVNRQLKSLEKSYPSNKFVLARAMALRALMRLTEDRTRRDADTKRLLTDAIEMDDGVAVAYNGLGILMVNDCVASFGKFPNYQKARSSVLTACACFRTAVQMSPSVSGQQRYMNNRIWALTAYLFGYANANLPLDEPQLLAVLEAPTVDSFLARCLADLETYIELEDSPRSRVLATFCEVQSLRGYVAERHKDEAHRKVFDDAAMATLEAAIVGGNFRGKRVLDNLYPDKKSAAALVDFKKNKLFARLYARAEYKRKIDQWLDEGTKN